MKFEEVLPALREGKKIRVKGWKQIEYIYKPENEDDIRAEDYQAVNLSWQDLFSGDWEIIKETKKVKLRDLTPEQMQKWKDTNCISNKCNDCVFKKDNCVYLAYCLIKDKSIFTDEFLNQEIEIEEE